MVQPQDVWKSGSQNGVRGPSKITETLSGIHMVQDVHNNAKTLVSFLMVFIFAAMVQKQKWKKAAGELAQISTGTRVD